MSVLLGRAPRLRAAARRPDVRLLIEPERRLSGGPLDNVRGGSAVADRGPFTR